MNFKQHTYHALLYIFFHMYIFIWKFFFRFMDREANTKPANEIQKDLFRQPSIGTL